MNTEIRNWPHFVIEVLSIMLLLYCFTPLLASGKMADAQIPTHFDADGNPDASGSAKDLIYLPLLSLFVFAIMTLGEKFPKMINLGTKKTMAKLSDNGKEYLNANGWKLMRETKLCAMFIMAYISHWMTQIALGRAETMPMWGIWLPFCAMLAVLVAFMYKLYNWN